jgi:hypothetical protein
MRARDTRHVTRHGTRRAVLACTLPIWLGAMLGACDSGNTYPFGIEPPASMGTPFDDRYSFYSGRADQPRQVLEDFASLYRNVGWSKVEERGDDFLIMRFDESLLPKDRAALEALDEAGVSTYFDPSEDPMYRAADPHPERRLIEVRQNGVRWEYRVRRFYIGSDQALSTQLQQTYTPATAPE